MTREEMLRLFEAWLDGKTIQFRTNEGWQDTKFPSWDFTNDYRVKPKEPKPTYRPYDNAKEFIADSRKHGGWAKDLKWGGYMFINGIGDDDDFQNYLEDYIWEDDGSPCGVKEE